MRRRSVGSTAEKPPSDDRPYAKNLAIFTSGLDDFAASLLESLEPQIGEDEIEESEQYQTQKQLHETMLHVLEY